MKLQILFPSRNLGCLGFRCGRFYIDFFRRHGGGICGIGCFYHTGRRRGYLF